MEKDNKALALIATIEAMGRILGMQVIAEGVETERQLDRLRVVGNRLVQGYLFARPMNAGDTTRFIQGESRDVGHECYGVEGGGWPRQRFARSEIRQLRSRREGDYERRA